MRTGELHQLVKSDSERKGNGWCLLLGVGHSNCISKCHEKKEQILQEKLQLERELAELQGKCSMLQCQNFILGGQARNYQSVAEKAAVWCAQFKYKKCQGEVNRKQVCAMTVSAPLDWDPGKWDRDAWGETDDNDEEEWVGGISVPCWLGIRETRTPCGDRRRAGSPGGTESHGKERPREKLREAEMR